LYELAKGSKTLNAAPQNQTHMTVTAIQNGYIETVDASNASFVVFGAHLLIVKPTAA
jgi:hypothetical protein